VFDEFANGDQDVEDELVNYVTLAVANGYALATTGIPADGNDQTVVPLDADVEDWQEAYLDYFNGEPYSATVHYVGARFRIPYHADLLGYGELDDTHAIESGVLHNPTHGVGAQVANFYSQWVHFRWHDSILPYGVSEHAFSVYNTGNSLHPDSDFFNNNQEMWERDGLDFDLEDTQQNEPTRYLRESPLID
jgi:acyl-homoserine lactone acylase PvdQ